MGRFIGNGTERTVVNNYIDSYLRGTNQYAKYLQSAPNFVTYYSRDPDESTENSGLGDVEEIVGRRSPLRYNRVQNVPLYMVEDSAPSLVADGILGVGYELESTAIIVPDTVVPKPNDLFLFSYWEQEKQSLFRITEVTTTAVDSNTYYQISFQSSPYDYHEVEEHQLVDKYEVVYDQVGSSKPAVIIESDYLLAAELEEVFDLVAAIYREDFYNEKLNMFLYQDDYTEKGLDHYIFDKYLHNFIKQEKLFISSKTFAQNILLVEIPVKRAFNLQSPYPALAQGKVSGFSVTYTLPASKLDTFKMFPIGVSEMCYLPTVGDPAPFNPLVVEFYKKFSKLLQEEDKTALADSLRTEWIQKIKDEFPKLNPSLETYISLPILLFILNRIGSYLVRSKSSKLGGKNHD